MQRVVRAFAACRLPLVVAGALLAGCAAGGASPPSLPQLDFDYYVCIVDPILQQGCSYMNCHGQQAQGLRVYSLGKLRYDLAGPPQTSWDRSHKPLTHTEINGNFNSARSFFVDVARPEDSLLLREPLPPAQGGPDHYGGAVWAGTDDPRYQAILAWANGATVPAAQQATCNALLSAVGE